MADKQLTEAGWKAFTKGKTASKDGYKDAALIKAFAAFEKAEKSGAEAQLEALDDIDKQAEALRKAYKADKALGEYIDDVLKSSAKERKAAEQAKKAEAESEADDEEESPALLTTKLVPLIRQVKKGDLVLNSLVAVAGKDAAVLLSRKTISAARRKLLAEHLGNAGGIKYIKGECLLEANALTFVVAAAAGGLAKKLKTALLEQTGLRLKVRVRGEDPNDIDEEGEDNEDSDDAQASGGDAGNAPSPAELAWRKRLAELERPLAQALKDQHPEATRLRGVSAFAQGKAEAGDFAAALKALEMLDKLLAAPTGATPTAAPVGANAPLPGRFVNQTKARLAWLATRQRVDADLKKLEAAILDHYRDTPHHAELAKRVRRFDTVLQALDTSLIDTLDAALNAADRSQRAALHEQAQATLRRYADFVRSDSLLPALDDNPFVALQTHQTLLKTLQVLEASLA